MEDLGNTENPATLKPPTVETLENEIKGLEDTITSKRKEIRKLQDANYLLRRKISQSDKITIDKSKKKDIHSKELDNDQLELNLDKILKLKEEIKVLLKVLKPKLQELKDLKDLQ